MIRLLEHATIAPCRRVSGASCFAVAAIAFAIATHALSQVVTYPNGVTVYEAAHHDVSPPLSELANAAVPPAIAAVPRVHRVLPLPPLRAGDGALPPEAAVTAAIVPAPKMPSTIVNFDGVGKGFSGPGGVFTIPGAPPDTVGAAGPNHYVQMVNTSFAVFNKAGTALAGPTTTNTLFAGFGGPCQTDNNGDGEVVYDSIADRWVLAQFAIATGFRYCVAVSTTANPTGTYNRYEFVFVNEFPDYPKLSKWPDAYYATFNMFDAAGTTFTGGRACALDRTKMLAGLPATMQCFTDPNNGGILPADLDGATLPPPGSPNPMLVLETTSSLAFYKFHVDWTTPANSTFTQTPLAVTAFTLPCLPTLICIPQLGPSELLDSLGDRLMNRLAYRNFGAFESLVSNHTIVAGSSVGLRWYEVRIIGGTPSVFQQGTFAPDADFRWMGSIAMDKFGNMAMGYSTSSATTHPSIRYVGRLAGDPAGTMPQGESTIIAGGGSQASTFNRWGDYSAMTVDPTDDCTFWYTTEYISTNGSFNWSTRIASFRFPACAGPALVSAVSRKTHGAAGQFNLALSLIAPPAINHNPTTEPRAGPAQTIVMTFDRPLASTGNPTISEGTATFSTKSIAGSSVTLNFSGVNDIQYVTFNLGSVSGTDGTSGGTGVVRVGFLAGDASQNRNVQPADVGIVRSNLLLPVGISNFLFDVIADGQILPSDVGLTRSKLLNALPPP